MMTMESALRYEFLGILLTNCGLMAPYGIKYCGQHWFRL